MGRAAVSGPDVGSLGRETSWDGVRAVVAGFGVSGFAAADNLTHLGASVTALAERATAAQLEKAELLEVLGARARWERGVDTFADAELRAGDVTARLLTACDQGSPREAVLTGTEGRIVVDEMHRPQHARLERNGEKPVELDVPHPVDDFYAELEHFVDLVLAGAPESPVMPLATSLRCAELLAAIRSELA